jgi:hypothetical protein
MRRTMRPTPVKSMVCAGAALALGMLVGSCGDDDGDADTGTVSMQGRLATASQKATYECALENPRILIRQLWVTTGEVVEGQPDTLDWVEIYSSNLAEAWEARQFSTQLPVGNYLAYKLRMKNEFEVGCGLDGQTYELRDTMSGSIPLDADQVSINTSHGTYEIDANNNFTVMTSSEVVSPFEILPGQVTSITWQFNLVGFDWVDTDDSSDFSTGDTLVNYRAAPGSGIFEFIVEYE